jgi:cytidylate kinase
MDFRVVCISRAIAAGGEGIGETVAERLGFVYVDEQIITRAAQLAQVDPKLIAAAEHQKPLLQRLIDRLALAHSSIGPTTAGGAPTDGFTAAQQDGYQGTEEDFRAFIRAAIHEVAEAGRAVIVAHAASMALTGFDGILRVLVTGSPDIRAARLAAARAINIEDAVTAVEESDRQRRHYFERFYNISEELPTHYDVVINTDVLTAERAVDIIIVAAQGRT